jgi:hypothetical protein
MSIAFRVGRAVIVLAHSLRESIKLLDSLLQGATGELSYWTDYSLQLSAPIHVPPTLRMYVGAFPRLTSNVFHIPISSGLS